MEQKIRTMKKLLIILLIAGISLGASAQHRYYVRSSYPRSHVVVSVGSPIYPYGYYDPFYDPYYRYGYYGYYSRPSKLDLEITDIRNDYRDKIWSAKHDNSLSAAERKRIVHRLKNERDREINQAERNYYRS
jgi:hypothetical protein